MAIALANSGGSVSAAFPASPYSASFGFTATAQNLLVVCTRYGNVATVPTPSGWSLAVSQDGSSEGGQVFYKVAAGGETGITFDTTGVSRLFAAFAEFSGTATSTPLDQMATGGSDTADTTADTGTTGTLAQADEVVVVNYTARNSRTVTQAAGYSLIYTDSTAQSIGAYYKVVSATTAVNADGTWSSGVADRNMIATFKAAAAAADRTQSRFIAAAGAAVDRASNW